MSFAASFVTNVLNSGPSKGLGEHASQLVTRIEKNSYDFSREHLFCISGRVSNAGHTICIYTNLQNQIH